MSDNCTADGGHIGRLQGEDEEDEEEAEERSIADGQTKKSVINVGENGGLPKRP